MEFVKEREKLVLVADYPKNDRKLTVGYGHTGTDVYKGMKITK
jgi:GH24 family phage-related lysozyme (muramidase)